MKNEDFEKICLGFYNDLHNHKKIVEEALMNVMEGFPATFTDAMNEPLDRGITKR